MKLTTLLKRVRRAGQAESPPSAVRPGPDVLSALVDDRYVLLDLKREQFLSLDAVGSRIWAGLEAGATSRELVAQLAAEYDAPESQLEHDARSFVDELLRRKLVVRA
jgi:hypothetical protein